MDRTVSLCFIFVSLLTCARTKVLNIHGFIPGNNEIYSAPYQVPATCMAVDDINNSSLLANYTLELTISAPECDMAEGVVALIEAMITQKPAPEQQPLMFLDGGCNAVTESLAALTGQLYNSTMVSFGSSSPSLSDRDTFPKLFRTIPSEIQVNSLRLAILKMFNWTRVATLHQTDSVFSMSTDDFSVRFNLMFPNSSSDGSNNQVLISSSFTGNPNISLQQIKEKDVRIIFAWMNEDQAVKMFCEAIHLGLMTTSHVWIIPGWYTRNWWKNAENGTNGRCSSQQLAKALDSSLAVDLYSSSIEPNGPSISGRDGSVFTNTYCNYQSAFMNMVANNDIKYPFLCSNLKRGPAVNKCSINKYSYTPFAYDAVWSIALALKRADDNLTANFSTSLRNFTYSNTNITDAIFNAMAATGFRGVSGNVSFDSTGSRNGLNALYQIRLVEGKGLCLELIAVHDPVKENYTFQNSSHIVWKEGYVPKDRVTVRPVYLDQHLVKALDIITSLSIIVALAILVFNIATIWKPLMANSAPHINTIVIIGCLLLLISCYLLGVDSNNPPLAPSDVNQRYSTICKLRLWLLAIGFTLSFGSLFGKTWQVHCVYVDSQLKHKPFRMWNFLIIISVLLLVDVIYLTIWTIMWPLQRSTSALFVLDSGNDVEDVQEQYEYCSCDKYNYLIGALYIVKGLVALFGLFLAYETRNVGYQYINDSKYVSIATYVVVIVVGISAPMSLVLAQNWFIKTAYILAVVLVNTSCLCCLLILYIPKAVFMAKGKDTLLTPGSDKGGIAITANELQMGWTDPDMLRSTPQNVIQNREKPKVTEDGQTCGSINSETDSGVNVNMDEVVTDNGASSTENNAGSSIQSSENITH